MTRTTCLAAVFLFVVAAAQVRAQHFDIFLGRPAVGTTSVVGGADVDAQAYDDVVRIFEVELGAAGGEFFALEPGINHPNFNDPAVTAYPASASPLQPGDVLRLLPRDFSVAGNTDVLFYWNGVGTATFTPAPASFRIDGGDPLSSTAGLGGAFDDHPFLVVDSDAFPGIYLASAVGVVQGFDPSAAVYFVMGTEELITAEFLGLTPEQFNLLSDDDLDAALEDVIERGAAYVEDHVVPEPAPLQLAVVAFLTSAAAIGCGRNCASRNTEALA